MARVCSHPYSTQTEMYMGNCRYAQVVQCVNCGTILARGAPQVRHTPTPYVVQRGGRNIIIYHCAICGAQTG